MKNILLKEWVKGEFLLSGVLKKCSFFVTSSPPYTHFLACCFEHFIRDSQNMLQSADFLCLSISSKSKMFSMLKKGDSVDFKFFPG